MPRKTNAPPEAEQVRETALDAGLTPTPESWPQWVEPAWKLFMRGQAVWAQLAARYGVDEKTVKRQVLRFHEAARVGLVLTHEDAHLRYVGGLQAIMAQAWADHATADNTSAQVGALRLAMEAMKNLAAASGVVTERSGHEVTGKEGGSLQVEYDFSHVSTQELAAIAGGSAGGTGETGGEGGSD